MKDKEKQVARESQRDKPRPAARGGKIKRMLKQSRGRLEEDRGEKIKRLHEKGVEGELEREGELSKRTMRTLHSPRASHLFVPEVAWLLWWTSRALQHNILPQLHLQLLWDAQVAGVALPRQRHLSHV